MLSAVQNPRFFLLQCRFQFNFPPKVRSFHRSSTVLHASQVVSSEPQTLSVTSSSSPSSEILTIRKSLLSRERKAVEIAEEYLNRLRQTEPQIRSFLHVSDTVMKEAKEIDEKIERNEELGPLAGVLIGVKDNICTSDMPSTGGSKILEDYRPAFDATAVKKLKESGAILVGKTNLDEFGMGSTTERSGFQVTANPWDVTRVPGGSSGGSAAAVSAGQCVVSLGSDTGGSVRQPASFCGVVGMKPTYGRVSRFGLMAYASSLDVIGCFGSSVTDTAILLEAISGHDRLDATSSKREVPSFASQYISAEILETKPLKGLRVGVISETLGDGVDAGVVSTIKAASSHLEELGCTVTEVSLPSFSLGLPAYYILASSESSSNLSRYDGVRYGNQAAAEELNSLYGNSRANGLGPEVKMRILMGTYALSAGYYDAYYKRAQQVRTLVQKSFKAALAENDILISPAAPSAAYKIGEKKNDPLAMYAGDIMTVNVNLAGLPALVLPCGFAEGGPSGLPIGLQMIGAPFDEGKLLRVGHIFEQTLQDACSPQMYSNPEHLDEGGFCGYNVRYADGSSTAGILAIEKLTLNANYGLEVIDNFVFGCGLRQNEPFFGQNPEGQNLVNGILGFGGGIESFTRQLGNHVQNKFEYCLKPWYDLNPANTSLRFGTDTKIVVEGQGVQTTSIIPTRGERVYYVIMEGISVDRKRVFYPNTSVFAARSDGTGGSIFDSGCPLTQLSSQVYVPLKKELLSFFYRNYHIQPVSPLDDFELCFERPYNFRGYPTIRFHYTEADFDIDPRSAFYENDKVFCLVIHRTKLSNAYSVILGAVQQANHRILHDIGNQKISWAEENCAILG